MRIAGVDVGGTSVKTALVDEKHKVSGKIKDPTPKTGPDGLVTLIAEQIERLEEKPEAIGVGIPGTISENKIIHVPNLANWSLDYDFAKALEKAVRVPIALGNDVNCGLLGEWLDGSAKELRNVLGVWMGTGIGGALILDGRPYNGSQGAAGEIGHVTAYPNGALCGCGRRGCVEAYAGRRMMTLTAKAMLESGAKTALFEIQDEEDKSRPTSKVWEQALKDSDELAVRLFSEAIDALGIGIGSVLNVLDLEQVVIGGGFGERMGDDLANRIASATLPHVMSPNPDLEFVASKLGDYSGIVGAAALAEALLVEG